MSLFDFPQPQTKPFSVQSKLQGQVSEQSLGRLTNVTLLREQMVTALKTNTAQNAITAIKEYLPSLIALSQQESKQAVPTGHFEFFWNSVVGRNKLSAKDANFHKYTKASEELAHVYFVYGLLHYRVAQGIVKDLPEFENEESKTQSTQRAEARKEAVRLLREAAGIFEAAPTLEDTDAFRPLDTRTATVRACQQMSLANAQEMMIMSAVETGKARVLIAKLCFGVTEKFSQIRKILGEGLGNGFHFLKPQWNLYLKAKQELYEALGRGHLGFQCGAEGEHGKAVAHYKKAMAMLGAISVSDDPSGGMEQIRGRVKSEKIRLQQELNVELNDNDKVYFMKVPPESELEIPPGVWSVTVLPFAPPAPVDAVYFDLTKTGPAPVGPFHIPVASPPTAAANTTTAPAVAPQPPRVFACAACTSHFSVNCNSGSIVKCPICQSENSITF